MKNLDEKSITNYSHNSSDFEYGLKDNVRSRLLNSLENDLNSQVKKLFLELHPSQQADFIVSISREIREKLLSIIGASNLDPQVLTHLENNIKNDVLEFLGVEESAKAINKLEVEEAVQVIEDLENQGISEILDHVSEEKRTEIEEALSYPEESVGRIMHQDAVVAKQYWTVGEATSHIQQKTDLPDDFQYIVIVDDDFQPISELPAGKLIKSKKQTVISEIMTNKSDLKILNANMDQEEAARIFGKYSLAYAPVVDEQNRLIGVVYANDLISSLEEQKNAALYDFAGISDEENVMDDTIRKVKFRYKWLILNLVTAFLASCTVGLFEETISKYVLLAVYMPIVAGMGGNAATQTLAILVRGIAFKQITLKSCLLTLKNELNAGAINGLINGVIVAMVVIIFNGDYKIALILAMAMIINLLVAAFFGTMVPLVMTKFGKDPATSATIFITTATDVLGFLVFLGLAALILT